MNDFWRSPDRYPLAARGAADKNCPLSQLALRPAPQSEPAVLLFLRRKVTRGAAAILPPTAPFYLYGPFEREGFATTPSNQAFDRSLRYRNPTWGLRDLEVVASIAQSVGFSAPTITEMPAKNLSVVFYRI